MWPLVGFHLACFYGMYWAVLVRGYPLYEDVHCTGKSLYGVVLYGLVLYEVVLVRGSPRTGLSCTGLSLYGDVHCTE